MLFRSGDLPAPPRTHRQRAGNRLCRTAFWLPPRSLQTPCLPPSLPPPLSPHLPSSLLSSFLFCWCLSASPQSLSGPDQVINRPGRALPETTSSLPLPALEHKLSAVMGDLQPRWRERKSPPPSLSLPHFPALLFPSALSHSAFSKCSH